MADRSPADQTPDEDLDITPEAAGATPPPGTDAADAAREDAADAPASEAASDEAASDEAAFDEAGAETSLQELADADPRTREELLAELLEAEARRDEYLEDVRRARAEFENYRKRTMREGAAQRAAGIAGLTTKLLDVLDDFDRTVDAAEKSQDEGLRKGVELVHGKLIEVLRGTGLTRIDEAGVPFDPNRHEAVQQVEAEGESPEQPEVAQVLRPGYALEDRVLRAAMVVVRQ